MRGQKHAKKQTKKHKQKHKQKRKQVSPLTVRHSKANAATRYGGSGTLITYLRDVLKFRERFAIVSIKKGKNSQFTTVDMLFGLLALIMLGCDRVYHINDRFKDEELLAKQLGLVRIFDQSTANRFLRKCNKWHINQ